jgi:hypothetical protein
MISRIGPAAACAIVVLASAALAGAAAAPAPDAHATDAVRRYVEALKKPDASAAFALLTKAQQRYFGDEANFASNLSSTAYRIVSYSIAKATQRNPRLVEVDVDQVVSFFNVATEGTSTARGTEPYFALFDGTAWGVKELVQPWKSYAPKTSGRTDGLVAIVDRVEFFDRRIQVDCTLRNLGTQAVQVLPLLKSTLAIAGGATYRALGTASFPLNDRQFFEGVRIYPEHQAVGWINFAVPSHTDVDMTATLTVAPAIADGAAAPVSVTVGPVRLPKL